MAQVYDWFKTFSENYINPLLENKKFVLFLVALACGTGAYTAVDMNGNKLVSSDLAVGKAKSEPIKTETVIVKEKVLQPVVNCNSDSQVIRDHIKEHH